MKFADVIKSTRNFAGVFVAWILVCMPNFRLISYVVEKLGSIHALSQASSKELKVKKLNFAYRN